MIHPAYLFIGNESEIVLKSNQLIKQSLCINSQYNGCDTCRSCKNFNTGQHHLVRYVRPENKYTSELIDFIFQVSSFAIEDNENFFFVLERADLLGIVCGNSLLKILEEPPKGYHFILLSPNLDSILPTIASRCVIIKELSSITNNSPLFNFFTTQFPTFVQFNKEIDKSKPHDKDMPDFIDQLIAYWSLKLKESVLNSSGQINYIQEILDILTDARMHTPMPGSTKMFLRNLYLQFLALKS